MAISTLRDITVKVRRITKSPSQSQISDDNIREYINSAILYDLPEELKMFDLKRSVTFYTTPNEDKYSTVNIPDTDPLYDFKNKYTVDMPAYIGGRDATVSQDRSRFYAMYPDTATEKAVTTGDGVQVSFSGTLSPTLLRRKVLFSMQDDDYNVIRMVDTPLNNEKGKLAQAGVPINPVEDPNNSINYLTGEYTVTFPSAPKAGSDINVSYVQVLPARPNDIFYFADYFTIRPVPDKVYPITLTVYAVPSELLDEGDELDIKAWSKYIALKASRSIFEDRLDMDSISKIEPFIKEQEVLILRRSLAIQSKERAFSIYSSGLDYNYRRPW